MLTTLLTLLLFHHWLGDFVFQSDWMAKNKSTNWWALLYHAFTYTMFLFVPVLAFGLATTHSLPWSFVVFVFLNGATHLMIDAITSRLNTHLYTTGKLHYFFVSVGFDQFLHMAILVYWLKLLYV